MPTVLNILLIRPGHVNENKTPFGVLFFITLEKEAVEK
jgi:hypothetical protein